jgi:hypothetical protein
MKRRIIAFLLVVLLIGTMTTHAFAKDSRILQIIPTLSFEGTTAKCKVTVTADNITDSIDVVVKLWRGSTCIATWTQSGAGYLFFNDTYSVTRNREYTLTVDAEINDVAQPRFSITKECE